MNKKYAGWFLIAGFCAMFIMVFLVTSPSNPTLGWNEMNIFMKVICVWGMFGCFGLWFWMLGANFKGGKTNYPIIWGFALLFGNVIAAICYFIFVYNKSKIFVNVN